MGCDIIHTGKKRFRRVFNSNRLFPAFWRVAFDKAIFLAPPLHLLNLYTAPRPPIPSLHPAPHPVPPSLFLQPGSALLKFRAGENQSILPSCPTPASVRCCLATGLPEDDWWGGTSGAAVASDSGKRLRRQPRVFIPSDGRFLRGAG